MARKIELTPYTPQWVQQCETEAVSLTAVFYSILQSIHHIGSTAVPRIKAKPIIDILIVVTSITAVDTFIQKIDGEAFLWRKKQVAT